MYHQITPHYFPPYGGFVSPTDCEPYRTAEGIIIVKYTIHLNQLVLAQTGLDIIDAAILDYIMSFCNSPSKEIQKCRITDEQGTRWTWIRYENIIRDMPLLRIKEKKTLTPRIQRIEQEGFIKIRRVQNMRQYYALTEKVDKLTFSDPVEKTTQGL
jgi:hypothetical protein